MNQAVRIRGRIHAERPGAPDAGVTFVELLVAIVLMGMCVLAVLVALRASMTATITDRDQAKASEWLQRAADDVYKAERVPCSSPTDPVAEYTTAIADAEANPPAGWGSGTGASIEILAVDYIGRDSSTQPYGWGPRTDPNYCLEPADCPTGPSCTAPLTAQRVTIEVTMPSGGVKRLETVKAETGDPP